MTEQTAADDNHLAAGDPRASQLLETWRQLDERYQQVVMATAGALAAFVQLRRVDPDTRALALRLLENPSDTELRALHEHPAGRGLSEWLLALPGYLDTSRGTATTTERRDLGAITVESEPTASTDLRGDVSRLFHRTTSSS